MGGGRAAVGIFIFFSGGPRRRELLLQRSNTQIALGDEGVCVRGARALLVEDETVELNGCDCEYFRFCLSVCLSVSFSIYLFLSFAHILSHLFIYACRARHTSLGFARMAWHGMAWHVLVWPRVWLAQSSSAGRGSR